MFQPADATVTIDDDTDWRHAALCQQFDIDLFFPEKGGSTADAKRICGMCDVSTQCLAYALSFERGHSGEMHGVWGGMSPKQRRRLAKGQPAEAETAICVICGQVGIRRLSMHMFRAHPAGAA